MGIYAELKQVSPYLLEKLKEYPDWMELFFSAQYLGDSPFWQEVTINPDNPIDVDWFNESINLAAEVLERLKTEKPEEFEKIKDTIPLILDEGKSAYLDMKKAWHDLHFVLTGKDTSVPLPFLMGENDEDHLPAINAVRGGAEIEYDVCYGYVRYLTPDEVKQVAEALSKFSYAQVRKRLEIRGRQEEHFADFFNYYYEPLVRYYQDAAAKGNAMFLYLT